MSKKTILWIVYFSGCVSSYLIPSLLGHPLVGLIAETSFVLGWVTVAAVL